MILWKEKEQDKKKLFEAELWQSTRWKIVRHNANLKWSVYIVDTWNSRKNGTHVKHEHFGSPGTLIASGRQRGTRLPQRSTQCVNTTRTWHYPADWALAAVKISIAGVWKPTFQSLLSLPLSPISRQERNYILYLKTYENKLLRLANTQRVQALCTISLEVYRRLRLQGPISVLHYFSYLCNAPRTSPYPGFSQWWWHCRSCSLKSQKPLSILSCHLNLLSDPAPTWIIPNSFLSNTQAHTNTTAKTDCCLPISLG